MVQKKASVSSIAETYAKRVWDDRDLGAIDECLHPQVLIHSLLGDFHGKDPMRQVVEAWLTAFPDLVVENTASISEGETAVLHWRAYGTHKGEFKGIQPTGKQIRYAGVSIYRIEEGKIVEYWAYLDMKHLLDQIS